MQATQEERERSLAMKIHTNLGITLEAQGLLMGACQSYRYPPPPLPFPHHRHYLTPPQFIIISSIGEILLLTFF
jgi:hypothetical protein